MESITIAELHHRFKKQGVSAREHISFKCPVCGTVQSIASLAKAGAPTDKVENFLGFSCEGRFSNAGPWPSDKKKGRAVDARRAVRGCDWTLGGLFRIHTLEVINDEGKPQPIFEVASAEEAQALERLMALRPAEPVNVTAAHSLTD